MKNITILKLLLITSFGVFNFGYTQTYDQNRDCVQGQPCPRVDGSGNKSQDVQMEHSGCQNKNGIIVCPKTHQ